MPPEADTPSCGDGSFDNRMRNPARELRDAEAKSLAEHSGLHPRHQEPEGMKERGFAALADRVHANKLAELSKGLERLNTPVMRHQVRSWTYLFKEMIKGEKLHDLRKNDRGYAVGHEVELQEYDQVHGRYTGCTALFDITYITGRNHASCAVSSAVLAPDYIILSLRRKD